MNEQTGTIDNRFKRIADRHFGDKIQDYFETYTGQATPEHVRDLIAATLQDHSIQSPIMHLQGDSYTETISETADAYVINGQKACFTQTSRYLKHYKIYNDDEHTHESISVASIIFSQTAQQLGESSGLVYETVVPKEVFES